METNDLKKKLMGLISDVIDETSIPGVDSFVEMDQSVIHYAGEGGDRYFRVILKETDGDAYFAPYNPEKES